VTAQPLVRYPLDALASFHYFRRDGQMENIIGTKRLCLIGDSGAFSALTQGTPIGMAEYLAWVKQWNPYLAWAATLDVIGDPAATLRNWRIMRDHHQLATVPTLHVGTDPAWLGNYAREGCDFLALGGMVGRELQALPWLVHVFRYARDHHPEMRFHLWGATRRKLLDNLPAYSADSSGILGAAYRFASLRLFNPQTAASVTVPMQHANVHRYGDLLRRHYRVDPAQVRRPTPENRHILIQIAARSTQLYSEWLTRRHNVPPPSWAVKIPPHLDPQPAHVKTGTRVVPVGASGSGERHELWMAVCGTVTDDRPPSTTGTRIHLVDSVSSNLVSLATGEKPAGWGARSAPEPLEEP
jgi:hypothetical protein